MVHELSGWVKVEFRAGDFYCIIIRLYSNFLERYLIFNIRQFYQAHSFSNAQYFIIHSIIWKVWGDFYFIFNKRFDGRLHIAFKVFILLLS